MTDDTARRFEDSIVLITGSTHGIGAATAKRFAREGASVVVNGRSEDAGAAVVEQITEADGEATFVRADLAEPKAIERLIDETVREYGHIDVLVNNAAAQVQETVMEATTEDWSLAMDVNLRAYWLCMKYASEHLSEGGSVVNISSNHARLTAPGVFPYNVTKSAINGMTRAMALEFGPEIRVNTVSPGWTRVQEIDSEEARQRWREIGELHPLDRVGKPDDIAGVITFLASDDAAFVTGANLLADGGRTAVMQDDTLINFKQDE
ncbi:SDR family NAD(P)-dependent oxidoreductase [Halomontanus rarus]|uniref:SDR family NAD(P)-dependent oxidoreductase n=1 Tax=Halomontanus rarus TaxID=3034020 RepID=UPI0023E8834A|nr:SDR family oxidoreductase [Halovivax sp. TS33]